MIARTHGAALARADLIEADRRVGKKALLARRLLDGPVDVAGRNFEPELRTRVKRLDRKSVV
jgi:hypothetical protein